jgi:hypothetical protein
MNLEKLLAENMIRFGTRNLTARDVRKILKEQGGSAPGPAVNANPIITAFITTPTNWPARFTTMVQTVTSLLNKYAVKYTNISNEKAAAYISLLQSVPAGGFKKIKDVNALKASIEFQDESISNFNEKIIQLNESPDEKGKVLTVGAVSATGISGNDAGNSSEMADILTYINDFNIARLASVDFLNLDSTGNFEGYYIVPFTRGRDYNLKIISPEKCFVEGNTGGGAPTPGAGSLFLANCLTNGTFYAYASQNYTAAAASSAGVQTTTTFNIVGPEVEAKLPPEMFAKMKIKLEATKQPEIIKVIEDAKKLGTITSLRIESAASFDEPVNYDNAAFAKEVGMAPNQVPADPRQDKEGVATDPMSGGNAFLAIMRGKALQAAIGNLAGVTPTMTAKVEKGGAAARYSKLFYTIKKPDGTTVITKDDLISVGVKTGVEQLAGQFKIIRLDATMS